MFVFVRKTITSIPNRDQSYYEYPLLVLRVSSIEIYPLLVLRVSPIDITCITSIQSPPPPLRVVRCQDYCVVVGRECECLLIRLCACLVFQAKTSATSIVGLLCGVIEIHTHIKLCAHAHTTTLTLHPSSHTH